MVRIILIILVLSFVAGCSALRQAPSTSPTTSAVIAKTQSANTDSSASDATEQAHDEEGFVINNAAPTVSIAFPVSDLDQFIAFLEQELQQRRYGTLQRVMTDPFRYRRYPADAVAVGSPTDLLNDFRYSFLPNVVFKEVKIAFSIAEAQTLLPGGTDATQLLEHSAPITAIVHSTGWGIEAEAEGLLFITEEEGELRWSGLVVAPNGFHPLPELETVAPPPGLVYRLQDEYWRINSDGAPQALVTHIGELSINPSATLAINREIGHEAVTLFHLSEGISETIELNGSSMFSAWSMPWVDDKTVLLAVAAPEENMLGQLALLDVESGALTVLDSEVSFYAQPSATDHGILYRAANGQVERWHEGQIQVVDTQSQHIDPDERRFIAPTLSSDGTQLAGLISGDFEPKNYMGYVVLDLADQSSAVVHTFLPIPTDAKIPWGIHWGPDSRWLVLNPPTWDPLEGGLRLVSLDGETNDYLGLETSNPVWLDGAHLVYNRLIEGEAHVERYDLETRENFRLDLPAGAQPVHYATAPAEP